MKFNAVALTSVGLLMLAAPWILRATPLFAWLCTMVLIALFMVIAGRAVTTKWLGVLIDERNVISLSRFQMALWTMLIVSAFFCAAMINIARHDPEALRIAVAPEVWALIGISATSLVASPLILTTKEEKPADPAQARQTIELLDIRDGGHADHEGQVVVNRDMNSARWSDMFTGEEVGNAAHLDLSRIQMFFFTIVLVVAYGAMLAKLFLELGEKGVLHQLPVLDSSMIALLGISHTGYLAAKAVPRSRDPNGAVQAGRTASTPDVSANIPPLG